MGAAPPRTSTRRLARWVPILDWSRSYDRRWLRGDVIAGIAVTAMIVPKNLGYAGIAGIPVENGLYAAAAARSSTRLFCTSRHISTGPSSSLAAVAGGAVLLTGLGGAEAAQLVAAIALATGALFLLVAILSWAGSPVPVASGRDRVPRRRRHRRRHRGAAEAHRDVRGRRPTRGRSSRRGSGAWATSRGDAAGRRVALAVILGLRFALPRVPGALVLVVGGLVGSVRLDLGAHGVALVGPVPRGLPLPQIPSLEVVSSNFPAIVISAFALLLIGFSQTAGDARAFATRHRYRIDVNQESVAQGMANLGAGVFQGMPVSTSLSASSLNESAGARTPVASLATGGVRHRDPDPARAAVLGAAQGRPRGDHHRRGRVRDDRHRGAAAPPPGEAVRLLDRDRRDAWASCRRASCWASSIGIVLSLGWLVYVATRPSMPLLGREAGTQVFRDLDEHPDDETHPGVAVLRIDGGLFFATAEAVDERVRAHHRRSSPALRPRARPRGRQLRRLAGRRQARRPPRAHRGGRRRPAPGARQAGRAAVLRAEGSSTGSGETTCTATSTGRSRRRRQPVLEGRRTRHLRRRHSPTRADDSVGDPCLERHDVRGVGRGRLRVRRPR